MGINPGPRRWFPDEIRRSWVKQKRPDPDEWIGSCVGVSYWLGEFFYCLLKQLHGVTECLQDSPQQRDSNKPPSQNQLQLGRAVLLCVFHDCVLLCACGLADRADVRRGTFSVFIFHMEAGIDGLH